MYVIKRNGQKQEFNKEKIITSIKNSARDCNYSLTYSDIKYISGTVEDELKKILIYKEMLSSQEIRMILYESLNKCGFEKIAKSYIET